MTSCLCNDIYLGFIKQYVVISQILALEKKWSSNIFYQRMTASEVCMHKSSLNYPEHPDYFFSLFMYEQAKIRGVLKSSRHN